MRFVTPLRKPFVRSRFFVCLALASLSGFVFPPPSQAGDAVGGNSKEEHEVQILKTAGGEPFGIWGEKSGSPAPTLFILASTIEGTLGKAYFRQCGNQLVEHGYLCVSIDLPCHGRQHRNGEPHGLTGWSQRAEEKEDFVAENNARLAAVLDYLIETGYTDPKYVAACGTSRGGYLALHFAASDPRVQCVAAFAPVTELTALREFSNQKADSFVASLSLMTQTNRLAGRAAWIVIGDQDERVDTDRAIEFARQLTAASLQKELPSRVELHVMPESGGHTTPRGADQQAAEWILRQLP